MTSEPPGEGAVTEDYNDDNGGGGGGSIDDNTASGASCNVDLLFSSSSSSKSEFFTSIFILGSKFGFDTPLELRRFPKDGYYALKLPPIDRAR